MDNDPLDDYEKSLKKDLFEFYNIIINGLSGNDEEFEEVSLIIKYDLIPAINDNEGEIDKNTTLHTLLNLISERRQPRQYERNDLENSILFHLIRIYYFEIDNNSSEGYLKSKGLTIESLKNKYSGNIFGEFILEHCNKNNINNVDKSLSGLSISLPIAIKVNIYRYIDIIKTEFYTEPSLCKSDLGNIFELFINKIKDISKLNDLEGSDDANFDTFNLIILHLAKEAMSNPDYKKFIKMSISNNFFSKIFR